MPTPFRAKPRQTKAYVSFGDGPRLISEDFFITELSSFGVTRTTFRLLRRALRVPSIEIGSTQLVDLHSFYLALEAALAVGQPDFLAPGSHSIKHRTARSGRAGSASVTTSLDQDYLRSHYEHLVARIILKRRLQSSTAPPSATASLAREAINRILLQGVHLAPHEAQVRLNQRSAQYVNHHTPLPPPPQILGLEGGLSSNPLDCYPYPTNAP